MKRGDLFLFGGLALIGFGLYQFLRGRGSLVPANQFGAALTQRPGPQLRYGAPQLNETGARPVVTRENRGVVDAVQSGVGVAVDISKLLAGIGAIFRGRGAEHFPNRQNRIIFDRNHVEGAGSGTGEGGPLPEFPLPGQVNHEGGRFDDPIIDPFSGGFDPDRPFDSDVFAA